MRAQRVSRGKLRGFFHGVRSWGITVLVVLQARRGHFWSLRNDSSQWLLHHPDEP